MMVTVNFTSSFSSVSRFNAANKDSRVVLSISGLTEPRGGEERSEGRRATPLRDAFTFGETAERAVAPLAIEFGVGDERDGV